VSKDLDSEDGKQGEKGQQTGRCVGPALHRKDCQTIRTAARSFDTPGRQGKDERSVGSRRPAPCGFLAVFGWRSSGASVSDFRQRSSRKVVWRARTEAERQGPAGQPGELPAVGTAASVVTAAVPTPRGKTGCSTTADPIEEVHHGEQLVGELTDAACSRGGLPAGAPH
jgi:hypothetical protein